MPAPAVRGDGTAVDLLTWIPGTKSVLGTFEAWPEGFRGYLRAGVVRFAG